MVDTCVAPSKLHLKKELTALRKARLLRDPKTCSSWRFPVTSDSLTAACSFEYGNGYSRERKTDELLQLSSSSGNRQKRVYLYNWRHHSNKSSESGIKLDVDGSHISIEGNVEDNSNNHKVKPIGDTCLDGPPKVNSLGTNPETAMKRRVKKSRNTNRKKQSIKHLAVTKLPDLQTSSMGVLDSVEPSDDTDYYNSEDLQQLTQELTQKTAYRSPSASPIFSGSGCGNWSYSSKIFRSYRKEGSSQSCTPASTSSYYRQGRNTSIVESWDGTAASLDGDELDQLEFQRHQGYGVPCYWSKRAKDKGYGGFYSPSLSDTLRRKGRSLFCGSQTLHVKKRSSGSNKQKYPSKPSQGLPLLADNSCHGGNSSSDTASDEPRTNFGELELEASSRLDGRRWSSCKSQEQETTKPPEADIDTSEHTSLNQKYRPRSFDEIIGQNIIIHSLASAVRKGRIAPAYLFEGPRGTGKTTTARTFAASLNCLSAEDKRPCWNCRECTIFITGNGSYVREVDGTDKKGIDRVGYLLKNMSVATVVPRYKVFIIDECHMLSSRMWSAFINILEEPPSHLVLIFITIDPENLPSAIVSRCQKYHFSKVKDIDIICHLRKISSEENLDIELGALDLIALNSDGSLHDAVTMLEQLSLLGKRITPSLVNELVGVVSDEKLLDLLEIAMSSDTAETVKRSRDLMDSGVDPVALMSQLAGLIMDIIAGSNQLVDSESTGVLGGRNLSDDELKRLQQALNILSDSEKQLRLSSERSTWFTAALLQLGSGRNGEFSLSSSSSKQSSKKMDRSAHQMTKNNSSAIREFSSALISRESSGYSSPNSCASYNMTKKTKSSSATLPANTRVYLSSLDTHDMDDASSKKIVNCISPTKLAIIWRRCIQRCHSETLRQLLSSHGKLLSLTETEGALVASIVFEDGNIKSRAERYLSSITNSIEIVLQHNVKVRIGLMSENVIKMPNSIQETVVASHMDSNGLLSVETKGSESVKVSEKERYKGLLNLPRSLGCAETMIHGTPEKGDSSLLQDQGFPVATFPMVPSDKNVEPSRRKEKGRESFVKRTHTAAMDDRHLENAWLQAAGNNSSGMAAHSDSMRNLVLSQSGISSGNHAASVEFAISSKHWEDELNHETKALRSDVQGQYKKKVAGPVDQYAMSPSLLHSNGFTTSVDEENMEYKSGHGCNGLFCWRTQKGKVKQGTHVQSPETGRIRCLGSVRSRWHRKAA